MPNPLTLARSVLLLFMMIIPGFALRKTGLIGDGISKGFANAILYATQPAMIIVGFIRPYDTEVMRIAAGVFVFSFVVHLVFYLLARKMFTKAPEQRSKVLRYGVIFSNAGFMGIPLIMAVLGEEAAIYASVYIIWFNVFSWSLGCMIYSGDKKYLSPKKMLLNPSSIAIVIGLIFFLLPIDGYVPEVIIEGLDMLRATVAPMSMMMIGMRLAEVNWKDTLRDKYLPLGVLVRLVVFPVIVWGILKLTQLTGLYYDETAFSTVLICSSTPCAAATGMFAEKFNGDAPYAGKLVAVTTVLSIITMPLVCLLMNI